MRCWIGIDPGKHGGVGVIGGDGYFVLPTPLIHDKEYDIGGMCEILKVYSSTDPFVIIERAQPMPQQGTVSMFTFGVGYGLWQGILTAIGLPFQIVHSRVWTKELLLGVPGEKKERNILAAKQLFPKWQPKLKKDLLLCDALLLAEYARRRGK